MKLSLIVPVHTGRADYAVELLREATAEPLPETQILVVDSSAGAEARTLADACAALENARYLRGPLNAADKRTIGAHHADGAYLLFVDSDCLISPAAIREHIDFMERAPAGVAAAIGPTVMMGEDTAYPWTVLRHSLKYNQCYDWPDRYERVLWGTTSNLVVRRSAFLAVGGFRPMRPAPVGGEDVDFGVRVTESVGTVATNPLAVVRHRREHITRLRPVARSLFWYGVADAALVDHHPARSTLHAPAVKAAVTVTAAVALSAGTRRGRRRLALAGTAAVGALALRAARRPDSLYAPTPQTPGAGVPEEAGRAWGPRVTARCLDAVFDVGVMVGAVLRGRPWLAARRFDYVNPTEFVDRAGPLGGSGVREAPGPETSRPNAPGPGTPVQDAPGRSRR
ncbi:glycosyltransferase family 2 protein [Kitasatospora sp. NPDC058444]|uniref:glycosyltransferase family 2 protein n=1 Tax=Kitasatospora sp. NPDC058444 TaxID=3346504 RepID=UPI0036587062